MFEKRLLGNTEIEISPIGISTSFGADQSVLEEAFDRGCNYFTWGTFIKGRSIHFKSFVRQKCSAGRREDLIIGLLSYSHSKFLGDIFLQSALKQLGTDYVDGLILGYFPKRPPQRILDWAQSVKERGLVRSIGLTTHNRSMVIPLANEKIIDYFHVRYNAVHRGAEQEIFPEKKRSGIGLVSFTATCWGQLLQGKKMPDGMSPPDAGDCYRFVLSNEAIDCCMMGVKNLEMFQQNFKSLEKGPMDETELQRMKSIGRHLYRKS